VKSTVQLAGNHTLKIVDIGFDGGRGYLKFQTSKRPAVVVWSDGGGWEHVSVSFRGRCPSWEEMCIVKDIFWHEDECVVQYHPAKSEYVNNHPYCLHLWRPLQQDMPVPPSILVGVK